MKRGIKEWSETASPISRKPTDISILRRLQLIYLGDFVKHPLSYLSSNTFNCSWKCNLKSDIIPRWYLCAVCSTSMLPIKPKIYKLWLTNFPEILLLWFAYLDQDWNKFSIERPSNSSSLNQCSNFFKKGKNMFLVKWWVIHES